MFLSALLLFVVFISRITQKHIGVDLTGILGEGRMAVLTIKVLL